jgi:hypothetical protein
MSGFRKRGLERVFTKGQSAAAVEYNRKLKNTSIHRGALFLTHTLKGNGTNAVCYTYSVVLEH